MNPDPLDVPAIREHFTFPEAAVSAVSAVSHVLTVVLPSTDGPVDHVAVHCAAGHHFRMAADRLPATGRTTEPTRPWPVPPSPSTCHAVPRLPRQDRLTW